MVNLDEILTNPHHHHNHIHFDLSKPVALKSSSALALDSTKGGGRGLFEFLEPYEPAHLRDRSINGHGGGKMPSTYRNGTVKSKPYELSRPSQSQQSSQLNSMANGSSSFSLIADASCSSMSTTSAATHQSALLARLTSLSSTFKSIFVRPKASRMVSYDKFNGGSTNGNATNVTNGGGSGGTEFKLKLFSVSNNEMIGLYFFSKLLFFYIS
jgi:hypothetical protein